MGPNQSWVERQDDFSWWAGNVFPNTHQDTTGLLGYKGTLPPHGSHCFLLCKPWPLKEGRQTSWVNWVSLWRSLRELVSLCYHYKEHRGLQHLNFPPSLLHNVFNEVRSKLGMKNRCIRFQTEECTQENFNKTCIFLNIKFISNKRTENMVSFPVNLV